MSIPMKKNISFILVAFCITLAAGCASKKERLTASTMTVGIDAAYSSVTVGGTLALKAVCRTPKTDDPDVSPAWTIDMPLGSFAPANGKSTTFTATSTGTAVIRASVSDVSASFAITVVSTASTNGTVVPAPGGVTATAGNQQVVVTWNPVSGAVYYMIYWKTSAGLLKTNTTKISNAVSPYTHTGLTNGTALYYAVTAVDASGNESDLSATVTATPYDSTAIYGLFSETYARPTYAGIKLDTNNPPDTDGGWLGAWGSAALSDGTGATEKSEGSKGLKCAVASGTGGGGWWIQFGYDGVGNTQRSKDMSAFGAGYIRFDIRTPVDVQIKLESTTGTKLFWVSTKGVALDDAWHSVAIPIADFIGLDLTNITVPAGFHATSNGFTYYVDNVRWEK